MRMTISMLTILAASAVMAEPDVSAVTDVPVVKVTLGDKENGKIVPKTLWGIFFEDINWATDGGLNPEMLANGGFNWVQDDHQAIPGFSVLNCAEDGWELDFRESGMGRVSFQYGSPVNPNTAKHLRIESFGAGRAGVRNRGLDGMWLRAGEPYRLVYDWREVKQEGIDYQLGPWKRETVEFTADAADMSRKLVDCETYEIVIEPDKDRSTLSLLVKGRRAIEFDNVSLQPTGPNLVRAGLRKDLVDRLADLKPAFVRFTGGCVTEGCDFQHWYDWRRTVGPKERRECVQNRWAKRGKPYWQTFDVGYYEYFRLCEEIGAEPLPICVAGITCQFSPVHACAIQDSDYFAKVIIDLIEFANGGVDTLWGKVRAEMGHPKPFNLKMVGIGNENWDAVFYDRVDQITKIIRQVHPEIKIIGSAGTGVKGKRYEYGWSRITSENSDLVDEHFYMSPEWFLGSFRRYDGFDRKRPHIYAGEYACHHKENRKKIPNTQWSAVCEAIAMAGFERNCDVVEMASYAPLFGREGHCQWDPNLIYYSGTESWLTPNYYVQQLFSVNRPDVEVPVEISDETGFAACAGYVGNRAIVKFVNASEGARKVAVNLGGRFRVTTLAGGKMATNSHEKAEVKPETREVTLVSGQPFELPPCSLTVLVQL